MKTLYILFSVVVALAFVAATGHSAEKPRKGKLYHVVSFKFKETATPEQIKQVETSFAELKKKIKEIKGLDWGTNVSPEKLNKGYTHCWVLSFNSEKDRDAYLVHPEHKAFGGSLGPVLADAFVVDFWAEK